MFHVTSPVRQDTLPLDLNSATVARLGYPWRPVKRSFGHTSEESFEPLTFGLWVALMVGQTLRQSHKHIGSRGPGGGGRWGAGPPPGDPRATTFFQAVLEGNRILDKCSSKELSIVAHHTQYGKGTALMIRAHGVLPKG